MQAQRANEKVLKYGYSKGLSELAPRAPAGARDSVVFAQVLHMKQSNTLFPPIFASSWLGVGGVGGGHGPNSATNAQFFFGLFFS